MGMFPPRLLDTIAAIGVPDEDDPDDLNKVHWTGTAFTYGHIKQEVETDEGPAWHIRGYLVTNRHVAECNAQLTVLFRPAATDEAIAVRMTPHKETGESPWVCHPDPDVDVAVTGALEGYMAERHPGQRLERMVSQQAFSIEELREMGVTEGDSVAVLGFPLGAVEPPTGRPLLRAGVISRIQPTFAGHQSNFLIDAQIFPGNSGGPVLLVPQVMSVTDSPPVSEGGLIGIVHATLLHRDVAVSPQTGLVRTVFEENAGLGVVIPVNRIHEAIDHFEALHPLPKDPEPAVP